MKSKYKIEAMDNGPRVKPAYRRTLSGVRSWFKNHTSVTFAILTNRETSATYSLQRDATTNGFTKVQRFG